MMRSMPWLVCVLLAAVTGEADDATLVDEKLEPHRVTLQSLRNNRISYFDQQRNYRRARLDQFLQWRCVEAAPAAKDNPYAMIELIDGQRLRGEWIGADETGDALVWRHALLGHTTIPLDQVRGFYKPGAAPPSKHLEQDTIVLTNGDSMFGIVLGVQAAGVTFEPDGQDQAIALAVQLMRRMDLANPLQTKPAPGHMIYFKDDSRVLAERIAIDDGKLVLEDDGAMPIPMSQIARIDFADARRRLVGLPSLEMTVTGGGEVFGMAMKPRVQGADVLLHAPIAVTFSLPSGALRFGAVAQVDIDDERPSMWADFELIVEVDGKEAARHHLTAENRAADVNVKCRGSVLQLRVESGANGPIMDRLRLRDPVILIKPDAAR